MFVQTLRRFLKDQAQRLDGDSMCPGAMSLKRL